MPDSVSPKPHHPRRIGGAELRDGVIVLAVAWLFWFAWYTDDSGHGERAFLLLPVVLLAPFGLGAVVSGVAVRYEWPGRRWIALVPFILVAAAIAAVWVRYF
jgi:hypothetical protein